MSNESSQYQICPDIRYQRVDDEGVVVRQTDGEVLVLNDVAMSIVEFIGAGTSAANIIPDLADQYDVGPDRLETDVAGFLSELIDAGVIRNIEEVI